MQNAPREVVKMFNALMKDLHKAGLEREEREAKADPVKHRLSKTFRGGSGYSYFSAGKDGRGSKVSFCYSRNPNVAGYYLLWREIETKKKIARDQYDSTTSKRAATRWVQEKAKAFKADQTKPPEAAAV